MKVLVVLWRSIEYVKVAFALDTDFKDRGEVTTAVAVIWRRPHGRELVIEQNLVAGVAELVRSEDVRHLIGVQEPLHNGTPKCIPCASAAEKCSLHEQIHRDSVGITGLLQCTHLADMEKSSLSGSGSDHTRSAIGPSCGISSGLECQSLRYFHIYNH